MRDQCVEICLRVEAILNHPNESFQPPESIELLPAIDARAGAVQRIAKKIDRLVKRLERYWEWMSILSAVCK